MSDSEAVSDPSAELAKLRAENEKLRDEIAHEPAKGSRGKSILSAFLIIVACVLAPLSTVSVWAKGEVTDTDRYVQTVSPLATNPAVQQAVADRISNEIFQRINVEELTTNVVDAIASNDRLTANQQAALKALAGPLASGIESFVGSQVQRVVESPQFAQAWDQANTVAHTALVKALSGEDSGALSVQNNEVILNLGPVLDQVKAALVAKGFTVVENVPSVNAQLVLFQSESLGKLQTAYSALESVGFWLPIGVLIIAIIGLLVANKRHVAAIGLGVGLFISMGVATLALGFAKTVYMNELPGTVNRDAASAVFDTLTLYLKESLMTGVVVGVLLILAGYFAGPSNSSKSIRAFFVRSAAAIQGQLYRYGATMDRVRAVVRQYATLLRFAALVITLFAIFLQQYKTASFIVWATIILLIVLFVIQIFASNETPTDDNAQEPADEVGAPA